MIKTPKVPTIEQTLIRLESSRFRAGFHLDAKDIAYINSKGMDTIRSHAADFVRVRLSPAYPENDGKQTPFRGHPVFKAMHATACCCRGCLFKWYNIRKGAALDEDHQERIVNLIMAWIAKQLTISS